VDNVPSANKYQKDIACGVDSVTKDT